MTKLIGKGWTFRLKRADPSSNVPEVELNVASYDPVEGFELLAVFSNDVSTAWRNLFKAHEQVECVGTLLVDGVPVAGFQNVAGLTAVDYEETLEKSEAPVTWREAEMTVKHKRDVVREGAVRVAVERQRERRNTQRRNEQSKNTPTVGRPVNPEDMR